VKRFLMRVIPVSIWIYPFQHVIIACYLSF
jgi:hypothetical protein